MPLLQVKFRYPADGKLAAIGESMPIFFDRKDGAVVLYETASWKPLWNLPKSAVTRPEPLVVSWPPAIAVGW